MECNIVIYLKRKHNLATIFFILTLASSFSLPLKATHLSENPGNKDHSDKGTEKTLLQKNDPKTDEQIDQLLIEMGREIRSRIDEESSGRDMKFLAIDLASKIQKMMPPPTKLSSIRSNRQLMESLLLP